MNKIMTVAYREFLTTVRTKAFVLSVVLMPGLIIGAIYGGKAVQEMAMKEEVPTRVLAVVDHTGVLIPALQGQVATHNAQRPNQPFELEPVPPTEADPNALMGRVRSDDLYAYIILPADTLDPNSASVCELARSDNQLHVGEKIEDMVNESVFAVRCQQAGINLAKVMTLRSAVELRELDTATGEVVRSHKFARIMTPFAFMFLLFMGTFGISQGLLTTVIEEKSSRVVELLLSAVSPLQLMAGKILGTSAVGFLLLMVWGGVGYFGAQRYDVSELVTGYRLFLAVMYFIPGFLLMASILAAIGSACNELKEAQSMVFPISILTIIPMLFWFFIAEHPGSVMSIVLSYIPPITPFVMILRVCSDPGTPAWQILSTLGILWIGVAIAMWAAGKVFRVGVLMYGKPPSLGELVRWVRHT